MFTCSKRVANLDFSNVRKSSELSFRLHARRYVHENKLIGEVGKCVKDFKLVTRPDDGMAFSLFSIRSLLSLSSSGLEGLA